MGAILGFWGKAAAAKRFPKHYRTYRVRERWMRESRCYFSVIHPKSGGGGKKWGYGTPVSYAYANTNLNLNHNLTRNLDFIKLKLEVTA